jgi:hypothetical protein
MMASSATVRFVDDTDGSITKRINSLNDPDHGVVVVSAPPSIRRIGTVVAEIADVLGKTEGALDCARGLNHALSFAVPWMVSEKVTDLVVRDAQTLSDSGCALQLIHLSLLTGSRIWFLADCGLEDDHQLRRLLYSWQVVPLVGEDEFNEAWQQSRPASDRTTALKRHASFPRNLPTDDFGSFFARCKEDLSPAEFALVDALYWAAFVTGLRTFGAAEDEVAVSVGLHRFVATLPTTEQIIVAVRAFQVAACYRGLFFEVDLPRFLQRASTLTLSAKMIDEDWDRLSIFTVPRDAVIGVLVIIGVPAEDIVNLQASEVASDGSFVTVGCKRYEVPVPARRYLVAQNLHRLSLGHPDDALFLLGDGRTERTPSDDVKLGRYILDVTKASGLALKTPRAQGLRDDRNWTHRHGFRLRELAS